MNGLNEAALPGMPSSVLSVISSPITETLITYLSVS